MVEWAGVDLGGEWRQEWGKGRAGVCAGFGLHRKELENSLTGKFPGCELKQLSRPRGPFFLPSLISPPFLSFLSLPDPVLGLKAPRAFALSILQPFLYFLC